MYIYKEGSVYTKGEIIVYNQKEIFVYNGDVGFVYSERFVLNSSSIVVI